MYLLSRLALFDIHVKCPGCVLNRFPPKNLYHLIVGMVINLLVGVYNFQPHSKESLLKVGWMTIPNSLRPSSCSLCFAGNLAAKQRLLRGSRKRLALATPRRGKTIVFGAVECITAYLEIYIYIVFI